MLDLSVSTEALSLACNCSNWVRDASGHAVLSIAVIRIITSIFSIIGSASIILSVLLTGKLSAAEVHPLFILSVADFIFSVLWMIGGVVWINPGGGGWATNTSVPHTGMCYVLGTATTMTGLVTYLLTTVYAVSALLRIREVYCNNGQVLPSKDTRKKYRHCITVIIYIASWVLPVVIVLPAVESIVGINSTNRGCWCVLDFFNLRPDDGLDGIDSKFNKFAITHATVIGISFLLISILLVVMYTVTFLYAKKIIRMNTDSEASRGEKMIRTIVKRLSLYLLIFFVSGFPALIASFLVWGEKERLHLDETSDLFVLYVHAIFIPLQGFLNSIVYGWSRKEFRKAINIKERIQYTRSKQQNYESLNHSRMPDSSYGTAGLSKSVTAS